jgi:hypothetical protein
MVLVRYVQQLRHGGLSKDNTTEAQYLFNGPQHGCTRDPGKSNSPARLTGGRQQARPRGPRPTLARAFSAFHLAPLQGLDWAVETRPSQATSREADDEPHAAEKSLKASDVAPQSASETVPGTAGCRVGYSCRRLERGSKAGAVLGWKTSGLDLVKNRTLRGNAMYMSNALNSKCLVNFPSYTTYNV